MKNDYHILFCVHLHGIECQGNVDVDVSWKDHMVVKNAVVYLQQI